ncbi:MAG: kelch repeat-containing protein [Actinomycetota bacterium]
MAFTSSMTPFTLPQAVSRPTVFAAGQGLLIVGGLTAADTTTQDILHVALPQGVVSPAGRLPVPVHDAAGAVVNGRDLVFGGGSTIVSSAVQDVTPGSSPLVIGHLPQPRADLVAVSDASAGYILGGFDGTLGSTTILRTRDGRTFAVAGTLPVSVRYPAVAALGRSIWLFGGEHEGKQVTDIQRIDLSTGRGTVAGHLPHPLAHAGAFTLRGEILVAGGRVGSTTTDEILRFDPVRLRFASAGRLPVGRSDFGVAVVGGTAYLVGGESPKPVDNVIQVRAQAGGTP